MIGDSSSDRTACVGDPGPACSPPSPASPRLTHLELATTSRLPRFGRSSTFSSGPTRARCSRPPACGFPQSEPHGSRPSRGNGRRDAGVGAGSPASAVRSETGSTSRPCTAGISWSWPRGPRWRRCARCCRGWTATGRASAASACWPGRPRRTICPATAGSTCPACAPGSTCGSPWSARTPPGTGEQGVVPVLFRGLEVDPRRHRGRGGRTASALQVRGAGGADARGGRERDPGPPGARPPLHAAVVPPLCGGFALHVCRGAGVPLSDFSRRCPSAGSDGSGLGRLTPAPDCLVWHSHGVRTTREGEAS